MIVFGTRTKRQGRGFILRTCTRCRAERIHFVAQSTSKFTLYFVPTFTTSTKALLVCTECERTEEIGGDQARQSIAEALSQEAMVAYLESRSSGGQGTASTANQGAMADPSDPLALGTVVVALTAALADGEVEENEAAAIAHAIETISSSTQSGPVRTAAVVAFREFPTLLAYVASPTTPPIPVMLARVGVFARDLAPDDQMRFIGQLAWLGHVVSRAASRGSDAALAAVDTAFVHMGYEAREVATALAFCDAQGG